MALTESQNSTRGAWVAFANLAANARAKIGAWLKNSGDRSITQRIAGAAFLIRVFSAGLIYLSQILLARWMGSFEFGIYVYVWTLVLMVGDLSDLGFATAAQRFIPEYSKRGALDLLRGYLSRSRWIAVGSATSLAGIGILAIHLLKPYMPGYLALPLSIACATLPFYSLMQMQDGIARAHSWINVALLPAYVVRHLIMLAIVSAAYLFDLPATAETAVIAVAVALMLTVIGQTIVLNRKLARTVAPGPKATDVRTWLSVSLPILIVEGFYLLLTNTDIIMLHHFRTPEDVAVYYAAAKTLVLITFVHFAVSAAVGHRFSEYHVTNDHARLAEVLSDSIRWTFWASLAATAVILAMGPLLLSLFGAQFSEGYRLMLILAVGLMARASLGPVERLLNMLGEQKVCAVVYAAAFILNLVIGMVLIPRIGVDGAAIATSTALIVESVALFLVTRQRLGMHVFIFGRA
ncbi:MAG: flippase [Alphaproteobacteria bacterium]|nr:flippase [Alphaproteobacteria bacterium]